MQSLHWLLATFSAPRCRLDWPCLAIFDMYAPFRNLLSPRVVPMTLVFVFCVLAIYLQPTIVLAQSGQGGSFGQGLKNVQTLIVGPESGALLDKVSADSILTKIINWILGLAAVIAVGVIIWGGLMYILSFGDEGKAGTAKKIIFYAVIGLILVGGSFVIVRMVRDILIK